ncbi:cell division cycle-associated protein 3-like [Sciurus carolinensis]|uniref:cell division cycle-associated protein 3-like n=1 Tax=Sciurus carolinensis TaxID=30640 RepID=UPI001FB35E04|nr:cell division cycle-associated protein 3-like [Sciurus carolinensis]
MKTSSADPQSPLVKELGDVFETEASKSNLPPESVLTLGEPSSSELDLPLATQLSLEDQMLPWNDPELPSKQVSSPESARHPTKTPVASESADNSSKDAESP